MSAPRPLFLVLLGALAACVLLLVAHRRSLSLTPVFASAALPATATGSFTEGSGWYPGDALPRASAQLRRWGSWTGADAHTGSLTLGPFPAPRTLRFAVGGYPDGAGNSLRLERTDSGETLPLNHPAVGERWSIVDVTLPAAWTGRPVRLVATDAATGLGGWLAVSEPLRGGRSDGNHALLESLTCFALNALLLALLWLPAARILSGTTLPAYWQPLAATAAVAAAGYLIYWAYLAAPWLGLTATALLYLTALTLLLLPPSAFRLPPSAFHLSPSAFLPLALGLFHLAALHLYPTPHDTYTLAAHRYREALPGDNVLTHIYAERLFAGESPRNPIDEWQSSERPPLQIGWQLLTWPVAKWLQLDRKSFSAAAAIWLQLSWVAAVYGLFRHLGFASRRALAWTATLGCTGFLLLNTVYTWPKLSAGAFTLGAFALLCLPRPGSPLSTPLTLATAAAFAALAWLSHGGAAFSFLALVPFLFPLVRHLRLSPLKFQISILQPLLLPAAVFLVFVLPWVAYQKFYDPPGHHLLKLHFAGVKKPDARGVLPAIRDAYAPLDAATIGQHKLANLHSHVFGHASHLLDVRPAGATDRRHEEFFHTGRALTWWPFVALVALALRVSPSAPRLRHILDRGVLTLFAWLLATLVVTSLLIFGPYNASIHHGSYAVMLGLFVAFSVVIERASPRWLPLLLGLQLVTLATTWLVPNLLITTPPAALPWLLLAAVPLLLPASFHVLREIPPAALPAEPTTSRHVLGDKLHAPDAPACPASSPASPVTPASFASRTALILVVAGVALLLFLRKPHALLTPQLWAEDGSIFLVQNDQLGLAALVEPYAGYLHTLPRLIAFAAALTCDPAWWPAFYNLCTFAIWIAVVARLFSPRLDLPGKPWLAFALLAVPHTGEVYGHITNLQWMTAFVLVQQLLIAAPRTRTEWIGDLAILAVVALTGPFVIIFLPLFAVRCLLPLLTRLRSAPDAPRPLLSPPLLAATGLVLLCAAVQAWLVVRTGPRFDYQSAAFQLLPTLEILGRRLLAWPLFGREIAFALPKLALALGGTAFLLALATWVLRPHPRRAQRAFVLAAFALITLAALYRTRPDTWAGDNIDYGDRYFYIPRVLLAWLLIWEFTSRPPAIAAAARLACLLPLIVHCAAFSIPAPRDYEWAKHVAPIRAGSRADIPTLPEGWTLEYLGRPPR